MNGYSVGIICNNPRVGGGALTRAAALKQTRFIDLCDTFHLPIDLPGGPAGCHDRARGGNAGHADCGHAGCACDRASGVPVITIVLRRCRPRRCADGGLASPGGHGIAAPVCLAFGAVGFDPDRGVAAACKQEIAAADDPLVRRKELEAHYQAGFTAAHGRALWRDHYRAGQYTSAAVQLGG